MAQHTTTIKPVAINAPATRVWKILTDLEKYPVLNDMTAQQRQSLFSTVIADNPEVAAYVMDLYSNGRMCFLQDLCNLVVDLAVIIGGPVLCDIIAGAIPVIGPLLCNIVIDIAEDLLVGLCNALPC